MIAIRAVNVVDVAAGRVLAGQTVLVTGDRIIGVGTTAIPAGAQIIEGRGQYLIPGLWDMHVHGSSLASFMPLYIANGVTGIRDMYTPMIGVKDVRRQIAEGKIEGPEIVAAGRLIDGDPPIWPGSIVAKNADEGRKAVETALEEGSDFLKVYSRLSREAFFGIAAEAKAKGKVFAGHVPNSVSVLEAAKAGQKSNEHLQGFLAECSSVDIKTLEGKTGLEKLRVYVETFDEGRAKKLIHELNKSEMWQCPTLVVLQNVARLDDPDLAKDPNMKYVPTFISMGWDPSKDFRFKSRTAEDWAAGRKSFALTRRLVKLLSLAKAKLLAGTDTLNPYVFPGFSLHDELGLLVACGLSPAEALRAATLNPARYFSRENEIGQIKKGLRADMVLLDENPLADIANTKRIRAVIARGKVFDRSKLNRMLSEVSTGW
jgi:hypothetical protein